MILRQNRLRIIPSILRGRLLVIIIINSIDWSAHILARCYAATNDQIEIKHVRIVKLNRISLVNPIDNIGLDARPIQ